MAVRRFAWINVILVAALAAALAAFGAVIFTGGGNSRTALEIRDASSSRVYGRWVFAGEKEFAIEFIHSVNQSPVQERFLIEESETGEKQITPKSVRFYAFGAGMRSDVEEGQTLERDGDSLVLSGFNVSYPELNYIVGTVSDHILFINGEEVSLRDLCGRNAHITIQPR